MLEIGFIPARSLEPEPCRSDLLVEAVGTTGRALRQGRITEFLQHVLGMAAGRTLIGINWHD